MAYTTINKSSDFFNTKLYVGNGGTQALTGVGFQPDFTWIKKRTGGTTSHQVFDVLRGVTKRLFPDTTEEESTSASTLTAFGTDGFTVGSNTGVNDNSQNHVAWNWKANGAGSANTGGTINSTVSVNQTAGFSIVSWQGTNANASVGHGLSSEPTFVFYKVRGEAGDWAVYNKDLGANKYLRLNDNASEATDTGMFQNTDPTGGKLYVGGNLANKGFPMIAYCFTPKIGYSKISTYIGNGSSTNPPFVYTGFKPAFVLIKNLFVGNSWNIKDNKRRTASETTSFGNQTDGVLLSNSNANDQNANGLDLLSNGFKHRSNGADVNSSGGTYAYMAFGQSLVGSNNVPCTAR